MAFNFNDSLKAGKDGEKWIDGVLSAWFTIEAVTVEQERKDGIDRILIHTASEYRFTAEYKSDSRAGTSGNAFIELWSDWARRTPGWTATTKAQCLIHAIPFEQEIRFLDPVRVRSSLPYWLVKHGPIRDIQNERWVTRGICVPLSIIDKTCSFGIIKHTQSNFDWAVA